MAKTISLKYTKVSTSNTNGKPPTGDKTIWLDPDIRLYEIEDGRKNKEVGESKIIFIHGSSLVA